MKILKWLSHNILFLYTLFLLAFIPLYPKIPLIGVNNTFVYIRFDDVAIAAGVLLYLVQLVRRKATLKTPLTLTIIIFWAVGAISTLYGVLFIFPGLINVFPHLAFLEWLRQIEYLSVFFIAYSAVKDKKHLHWYVGGITTTLLAVVGYGFGQRLLGFPAFLTMNEEFAKGVPLRLSALDRIPSTFAGQYDLAAYLVMIIVLLGSMAIGYKKWYVKTILFISATLGLLLMMMTAQRTSFACYLLAISLMLVWQKKKLLIIPVVVLSIVLLQYFPGLSSRFSQTLTQANVVVDARTGQPVGIAQETVDKSGKKKTVVNEVQQTGENLPQGSGYINLPGSGKTTNGLIKKEALNKGGSQEINVSGNFVIKKVFAYDVSFTTRFQGEWPRAMEAFERNVLLGSGYSSISLATDNNYLRMLGETGLLGFVAFVLIFFVGGIYAYKVLPSIQDKPSKSFVIGTMCAIVGLAFNAVLIDVFVASKDAYILWILVGIMMAILVMYEKEKIDVYGEMKRILTTPIAIILYLLIFSFGVFWQSIGNYFVADDFVWLRSVADCTLTNCQSPLTTITNFFTHSGNFFYRPATDLYFYIMYAIFGLNSSFYHGVSVFLLFICAASIFVIARNVLKNSFFAFLVAVAFIVISGHYEAVIWISAIGHLAASTLTLLGLALYVLWRERKRSIYVILSLICIAIAPFFHEFGIIAPLFVLVYDLVWNRGKNTEKYLKRWWDLIYLLIIPAYLATKLFSGSWWSHGDYTYNLIKLPYNVIGNFFGYIVLLVFGTHSLSYYEILRSFGRQNLLLAAGVVIVILVICAVLVYLLLKKRKSESVKIVILSFLLFIVPLLPFLGLGNIASRYSYLSAFGLLLLAVYLLQRLYIWMRKINTQGAYAVVLLLAVVFIGFHGHEITRINTDWDKAGIVTNNMLIDFSNAYNSPNNGDTLPQTNTFYFINVPKTYGEAWVFPVGLKDALWFTFQNKNLTVIEATDATKALEDASKVKNGKVFEFENDGHVEQILKNKKPKTKSKS